MMNFYKKMMVFCLGLLCASFALQAQVPKLVLTTAKTIGQDFQFTLNYGSAVSVDWGDGNIVNYNSEGKPISGKLKGSVVTVSGLDITMLDCSSQGLTDLSVSELSDLQTLICSENSLTALNVLNNTKLIKLNCSSNQLEALRFSSAHTSMVELNVAYNAIASLQTISNLINLKVLICNDNDLSALSVTNAVNLETLWCHSNQISVLNVSRNTNLKSLLCYNNQIKTLLTKGLSALMYLWCDNNVLSSLDVSTSTKLNYLSADKNELSAMALPPLSYVRYLYLNDNSLGLSGLYSGVSTRDYTYSNQKLAIGAFVKLNEELDLSAQLETSDAQKTNAVFTWYGDGRAMVAGTDYTENAGKFVFINPFQQAYCEITSSLFPKLNKVVTSTVQIALTDGIGESTVQALKISVQDGRLIVYAPVKQPLKIFDLTGRLIRSIESVVGTVQIELPRGAYIVNQKKIIL